AVISILCCAGCGHAAGEENVSATMIPANSADTILLFFISSPSNVLCNAVENGLHPDLRVKKPPQRLVVRLAQVRARAHVHRNRTRNAGRKSFRRIVASRAVLLEHLLPTISGGRACRLRGRGMLVFWLRSIGLRKQRNRGDQQNPGHDSFWILHCFSLALLRAD